MRPIPLTILVLSIILSGCTTGVKSIHPLSSPATAVPDPRLEGLWRAKDDSKYLYIAYGPHATQSVNLILKFGKVPGADQLGYTESMNFFVTRTENHDYLNLNNDLFRLADGSSSTEASPKAYRFALYRFSKRGTLVLSMLNGKGFSRAVSAKKLKGDYFEDYLLLKDSPEHILSFIESSNPKDLCDPPQKFIKIGGP